MFLPKTKAYVGLPRNSKDLGGEPCGVCFGQGCMWKRDRADWARNRPGGRWAACRSCAGMERGISVPRVCWKDLGNVTKETFSPSMRQEMWFSIGPKVGSSVFRPVRSCAQLQSSQVTKNGINTQESGIKRFACLCSWKAGPGCLVTTSNHYRVVKVWLFFRPKMRQLKEALTGLFLY